MELTLSVDELLLIDWVLCYPAPSPTLDLESHMAWHDVRLANLQALTTALRKDQKLPEHQRGQSAAILWLEEGDIQKLLALCPTTHRWGASPVDCGLSLKLKLARALRGDPVSEEEGEASNETPVG